MKLVKSLILFVAFLAFYNSSYATHNRAGEITYEQIAAYTIRATITTYTKMSGQSIHADRPELDLYWGDGNAMETIQRDSFRMLAPDIRQNFYSATHTYPGPTFVGQPYVLWMKDPNRNSNILNINGGNSVNVEFYIQTEVVLLPTSFNMSNSSPELLAPAIDVAYLGQVFQHTPAAFDPDGDSIVYELATPMSEIGTTVPAYQMVDQIAAGPNNTYTLDPQTGIFTWDAPQQCGEYNIVYAIKSYRNGLYMGTVIRDLQIVVQCNTLSNLEVNGSNNNEFRVTSSNIGDTIQWDFLILKPYNEQAGIDVIAADFILNDLQTNLVQISPDSQRLELTYVPIDLNKFYDFHVNIVIRAYIEDPLANQYAAYDAIPMIWKGYGISSPINNIPENSTPVEDLNLVLLGNPILDQIRVQSNIAYEDLKVDIFDLTGRLIHSETIAQFENIWTKDVSDWSNSVYYLKFSLPSRDYQIMKVVVEH